MKVFFNCIMPILIGLACFAVFVGAVAPASAAVITQWSFNDQTTNPNIGDGTISLAGGVTFDSYNTGSSFDPDTPNYGYATTTYPAQGTGNDTAGIEFAVSTLGYDGISISFDLRTSNTSSKYYRTQYSLDSGVTWTDSTLFSSAGGDTWNNNNVVDLSSITGASDNANFKFRVLAEFAPTTSVYQPSKSSSAYAPTGKYRFDMVTFSSNAILTPGADVTWAVNSGNWDSIGNNWTGGSPDPNRYKDSDRAYFNNISGDSTITINAAGVSPFSTSISNAANTYTFTGGSIKTGSLSKSGAGTVVLAAMNEYVGGTTLNSGTLIVDGGDNRLGGANSTLDLRGGTFRTNTTGIASARRLTITNSATFDSNGFNSSTTGHTDINGLLTKNGNGNLALNGTVAFDPSGTIVINAGSVTFGATDDTITMWNGSTFDGNLILDMDSLNPTSPPRLNFNGTVPFAGSGEVQVQKSGIVLSNSNANSHLNPIHVDVKIHLNSLGNTFTKSDVTQANPLTVANPFVTTIGGTRDKDAGGAVPNNLHISQPISGNSDINVSNDPTGTGSGNLWLEAANTYTGTTMINGDHDSTLYIGVNDALPTGTDVIFGTGSALSGLPQGQARPKIDLNGYNQHVNSISNGIFEYVSKMGAFGFTNNGTQDSILTVGGSTTPYNSFGGVIKDGTHKVSLEKDGTSTLTLSNGNTYTGHTTVHGGILELADLLDPDFGTLISTGDISTDSLITTDTAGVFQIKNGSHTVGSIAGTGTTNVLDGAGLTVSTITQGTVNLGTGADITISGGDNSIGSITGNGNIALLSGTLTAGTIVGNSLNIGTGNANAVPEPGTLLLLLSAGMIGVGLRFRKK